MLSMAERSPPSSPGMLAGTRPVLHLSGPRLRSALETLIAGAEAHEGIERYVHALNLKAQLFRESLGGGRVAALDPEAFKVLCAFMAPVRRRIGRMLDERGFLALREALVALLDGADDTASADARMGAFQARFPKDREHRWVRDLAAEVLHFVDPEGYPLMCRWVWDARTNTGALREIWHGDDVDRQVLDVPDGYDTFLVLREELSQFLSDNGVFRDVMMYVDLLVAQIYADYVAAQGGSYLRSEFAAPQDPLVYARRMLGLDGVNQRTARTRLKGIDGEAHRLAEPDLLDFAKGRDRADS